MQWYDKVPGILLILSIINFTLAAPVLVQEKRGDVVHIPRDVVAVLGKRNDWREWLELLWEDYHKTPGDQVESSGAHASSGSAPLGADRASSSSSPLGADRALSNSAQVGEDRASSSSAPAGVGHASTSVVQAPARYPASSTTSPNPLIEPSSPSSSASSVYSDDEWWYEGDGKAHTRPLYTPTSGNGMTGAPHAPQPNPGPNSRPSTDPDQVDEHQVEHVQQPNPGPSNPELTDPDLQLDHQSLSTDSQVDHLAAIYAAKGKAKESRRASGTAREVGNAA